MSRGLLDKLEKTGLFAEPELDELRELSERLPDVRSFARELVRLGKLTLWQAGQLVLGRNILLGKYILIDVLSPDEVNPLFLAEHRAMQRKVVLRVLAKSLSQAEEWRNRFLAEAQLWASLEHPRLVRTYNAEQDAGRYFLVLEFVDGESLKQLVNDSGPLPPEALLQLAYETAEALGALHSRGIVYGCLRPTKIMITPEGSVRLLDRGFSLWLADQGAVSSENRDERCAGWHAPEVVKGAPADIRSDLFSLGTCLLFAATGREPRPIPRNQDPEIWRNEQLADADGLPQELTDLLARLLEIDPDRRPSSTREIMDELRPLVVVTSPSEEAVSQFAEPPQVAEAASIASVRTEYAEEFGGEKGPVEASVSPAQPGAEELTIAAAAEGSTAATGKAKIPLWQVALQKWQALTPAWKMVSAGLGLAVLLVLVGAGITIWLLGRGAPSSQASAAKRTPSESRPAASASRSSSIFPEIKPDLEFDPTKFDQPAAAGEKSSGRQAESAHSSALQPNQSSPEVVPSSAEPASPPGESSSTGQAPAEKPPEQVPAANQPSAQSIPEKESDKPAPGETADGVGKQPEAPPSSSPETTQGEAPFRDFPEVVDLPELSTSQTGQESAPFELGRVGGPPEAKWQLILLGGDRAYRKGWQFTVHELLGGEGGQSWLVQLEPGLSGKTQASPVAKIWREGVRLYFQWDAQAPLPQANYLRNCLLQVRVDGANRLLRLRQPVRVEMPALDFDRAAISVNLPAKWLPEDFLLWELVGLDEYGQSIQAQDKLPAAPQGNFNLFVVRKDRDGNTQPGAAMRVIFSSSSRGLTARLILDADTFRVIPREPKQWTIIRNSIEQQRREIEKKLNPPDKAKAPAERERAQLLIELRNLDAALWRFEFFEKTHKKARLHFRIFSEVGGQKLIFVET
ncbi:MAG: protein kinase [Thermoguttaceae bacterium]|nr:protein kinase [Thermoguttaceae bacterium]MDW8078595.1 protein kinase [Thermoguttaceae bacterium]